MGDNYPRVLAASAVAIALKPASQLFKNHAIGMSVVKNHTVWRPVVQKSQSLWSVFFEVRSRGRSTHGRALLIEIYKIPSRT